VADPQSPNPASLEPEPPDGPPEGQPLEPLNFGEPSEGLDFADTADFSFPDESAVAEPAGDETPAESLVVGEGLPDVGEEVVKPSLAEAEEAPTRRRSKWLAQADWIGVALLAIVIWLVVQAVTVNVIWTTAYLILLVLIPFSLWKTRARWTTPQITAVYTVLLAISTAALLTAIYWLGLELSQYQWDINAKTRPVVGTVSYSSAPTTIAAA
jgi:hypothetical protein